MHFLSNAPGGDCEFFHRDTGLLMRLMNVAALDERIKDALTEAGGRLAIARPSPTFASVAASETTTPMTACAS